MKIIIYKTIFKLIAKLGYEHISDDLLTISSDDFYHKSEKGGRNAYVQFYKEKISAVQKADICIFDITMHSLSIGFTIQKSLDYNKPTIVVYLKDNVHHLLTGIQDEKLIIKSYTDNTLEKVIKQAFKKAERLKEKRFNFFIRPFSSYLYK